MQQNFNPYVCQKPCVQAPSAAPNAVNINIFQPQAFASDSCTQNSSCNSAYNSNFYPLYQANQNPSLPLYPMNYNNMIQYPNSQSYVAQQ